MKKLYTIGALAILFASCRPSVNITTAPTSGVANFSSYMAIGNSLTAGYADNCLTVSGQLNSYPRRLFEQFSLVSGAGRAEGEFYQPLLHGDNGYGPYPSPRLVLSTVHYCLGDSSLAPIPLPSYSEDPEDKKVYVNPKGNGQVNNIAVPGIRVADYAFTSYGAVNPYSARFYHDPTGGTPLSELKYRMDNLHPTFFTMWLGANDVLGFATAGGNGDGSGNALPVLPNFYSKNDITPTPVFIANYDSAVSLAISTGARGALINIPDITKIPFFTTIPADGLFLTRQSQADSLTAFYSSLNYVFHIGANYFIVEDHLGNVRQAVPGELILLTLPKDNITCLGWGSYTAIPKDYVLTTEELQQIKSATTRFNEHIYGQAVRGDFAYVDMYTFMGTLASGIVYNGINYNAEYVTGGAFSLDGVHPNPRGYALIANQISTDINKKYKSTLPPIDANKYHGVLFP